MYGVSYLTNIAKLASNLFNTHCWEKTSDASQTVIIDFISCTNNSADFIDSTELTGEDPERETQKMRRWGGGAWHQRKECSHHGTKFDRLGLDAESYRVTRIEYAFSSIKILNTKMSVRNCSLTINQQAYLFLVFRPVLQDIAHCVLHAVRQCLTAYYQLQYEKSRKRSGEKHW